MAIYKKIKGKDVKVADVPITDHNQLDGRDAYGAHPISAIRNLPEKLTGLKTLSNTIRDNASRIGLRENEDGTLTFTDYNGQETTIQGGFMPDGETIELRETLDGDEKLTAIGLKTDNEILSGQDISSEFVNIKSVINAKGGYLDSYDFKKNTPTQQELTDYALQDIGIQDPAEIWDKTRVINLHNDKTWSWDLNSMTWSNLGNISIISDANNDGLHGLVTGSDADYMGSITSNGQIYINGLPELAAEVERDTEDITDLKSAVSTNTSNISNLQSTVSSHTSSISNLDTRVTNNSNNISSLQSAVSSEISNREAADTLLQQQLDGKVINNYSTSQTEAYSANYSNTNFTPISFTSKLYLNKTGSNTADLLTTKAEPSNDNIISVVSINQSFDWIDTSADLVLSRILPQNVELNNSNGYTFQLFFKTLGDDTVTFGARARYYDSVNDTWVYITSNQTFGSIDCSANDINTINFSLHFDSINGELSLPKNSNLVVEVFKKQNSATSLTTNYYCGVSEDNSNIYSYGQFIYNNSVLNTDQIADGAITYQKLDTNLQSDIDQIDTNASDISALESSKQDANLVFNNVTVSSGMWSSDLEYEDFAYKATIPLVNVTASMIPNAIFSYADSASGNYSTIVESYDGGVYIWGKSNDAIVIPIILVQKVM